LIVEPDAEVVQSYPRRQACSQAPQLVRSLFPEAEGVEQLLVDGLYDLADPGYPASQALRPRLSGVTFGWADNPRPVVLQPPPVIVGALEALVDHVVVRPQGGRRPYAPQPKVREGSEGEEGFCHLLVGGAGGPEAEAGDYPGGIHRDEQTETLVPSLRLLLQPTSAEPASHPCPRRLASRVGIALSCPGLRKGVFARPEESPGAGPGTR
jgi:hypothetical protein